jgi:DNA-binding MltR family transcriptional regulator
LPYELEDKDEEAAFYEQGSDRAVAVVCTSILDNRLTALLKAALKQDERVLPELFRSTGPLGSFGTKIRLAYVLELIPEGIYEDLLKITRIRNDFAHKVTIKSFEDDDAVRNRIQALRAFSVWKSLEEEYRAEIQQNPQDNNIRLAQSILRDELETMRDSFRLCVRFCIWHLVTAEKAVTKWKAARPVPTP